MAELNPFSISFGKQPIETIERFYQKNEILDNFSATPINQQIYIITGVRGSGKTVLMTMISSQLKKDEDWIVVSLNPETDLLQGLASRLCGMKICADWFRGAKINLSLLGLGVEIKGEPPVADYESAVFRMLEVLKRKNKRLLVTIDEVTNNTRMRIFSASFQIMIRDELPVFLLMTGLYENIFDLQNEKSLTFLYRAPKIHLPALNLSAIQSRYQSLFHLDDLHAKEMASLTTGYPFAFQALGYLTWQNAGDYQSVLPQYQQLLEEYVYDKIWSELSKKDKDVLLAIVQSEDKSVADIKSRLHLAENEFSPYRQRIIRKGLADGSERGYLRLTLPLFDEYVLQKLG